MASSASAVTLASPAEPLDEATARYVGALDAIGGLADGTEPSQALFEAANVRERIARLLADPQERSADALRTVAVLDERLRLQARRLGARVGMGRHRRRPVAEESNAPGILNQRDGAPAVPR